MPSAGDRDDFRAEALLPLVNRADAPSLLRGLPPATPSGRIELFSPGLEAECGQGLPRFKPLSSTRRFIVVSPASERRINSTFGGEAGHVDDIRCEMHPDDARELALTDGQLVQLFNDAGEVQLPLSVTDNVRRGTVFVPKGGWMADSPTGQTINALIPGHKADLAGGACYYDCTVDICAVA